MYTTRLWERNERMSDKEESVKENTRNDRYIE